MRLLDYLREDIWTEDLRRGPLVRRAFVGGLRVLLHAVSAFSTDLGPLRPAGLTMVTLLSLVPLLAIVSGIAQAFGYQEYLQQFIDENTQELPENVRMGVAQIQEAVDRADFQTLRLIGSAVLIWSIMTLFIRVESALNFTWHTRQRRPWLRRISDFVALIVLFPVLALAALSANSVVASASGMEDLPAWVEWIVQVSSGGLTHVVMWLAMTALFRFMPSADVKWKWAFLSGVIAGSGWLFTHQLWIAMQIGMARANAIYATVAAFPLLIVYLQTVWTVILFGAEVGYGAQHVHLLGPGNSLREPSFALRERLALAMVERVAMRFEAREGALGLPELARDLDVPPEWLEDVAECLVDARLLAFADKEQQSLLPARPIAALHLDEVLRSLRGRLEEVELQRIELTPETRERLDEAMRSQREALRARVLGHSESNGDASTPPALEAQVGGEGEVPAEDGQAGGEQAGDEADAAWSPRSN
jgi:membrane protein